MMNAQIFIFDKHIPEIEKFIKFGRDLYRYNLLVVFDDEWKVPREYKNRVVYTTTIKIPD